MGKIKGTVVCFCISLLAVCWPNGILGAPSCDPLLVRSHYQSSPISGDGSAVRRQQLLNQAKSLLDHLSSPTLGGSVDVLGNIPAYDTPNYYALENLETSLLLTLVNRLNALKSNSVIAANPTSSLAISEATFTSLVNQYQKLKVLIADCMPSKDNQIIQPALDDLHNTVVRIITGKLTKAELPNLCSKILTFNARLAATNAPAKVQDAVTDYIKSLTSALTGQSQVTISAVCSCLNDLETSVVTVVESDAPQRAQQLLSNLVNAVTNVIISGGGVGCNVIDVVKRYVAGIDQAIEQDESDRAKKIYRSVLSFEDELYKALIYSEPTDVAVESSPSPATVSDNSTSTLTQVESATPLLSDAAAIVSNGAAFIIKDLLVTEIDEDGNVVGVVRSGTYQIYNPSTYASSSGSFAVQDGTIESSPDGSIYLKSYGVYDVDLPSSGDKLRGNFSVEYNAVVQVDENGKRQFVESGIYTLTDAALGTAKSGEFTIVNSISQTNPDGSMEIIKSGVLSIDGSDATSSTNQPSLDSDGVYFLCTEKVSESLNSGGGIINIKKVETGNTESATLVISSSSETTNSDGSVDKTISGVYYVDGVDTDFATDNSNPSLIIMNGANFTITIHEVNVTDSYGEVHTDRTGSLIETDLITGIKKYATFVYWNHIETENLDGSTTKTASSKFTSLQTIVPGTNSSAAPTSSSGGTLITDSAKPLTITKDSLQALINSLNTGKAVQPAAASETQTSSTADHPSWDATSIFSDNTAFIIRELVTPIRDEQRNIVDQARMGTYSFQNPMTNKSWTGTFEVTDYTLKKLLSGQMVVTKSGEFVVNSPADGLASIEVQFLVVNIMSPKFDENGVMTIGEGGSYTVTVPEMGLSKFGTFVVTNRLQKAQSGDAVETITAGLLFVDNPDGSSSNAKIDSTEYDRYFLVEDDFFNAPDADGNLGTGIYSLKDPNSNEQITGTRVIQTYSTVENSDGTTVVRKGGVSYVDGSNFNSTSDSVIIDGAEFSSTYTYGYVTDANIDRYHIGVAVFDQFDSKTGAILSSCEIESLNILRNKNSDGSGTVTGFGRLIINGSSDNSQATPSNTAPATYQSQPSTQGSKPTGQTVTTPTSQTTTNDQVSVSGAASIDPATLATDGTSFIINKYFVPERDAAGNIVTIRKWGEFSLMDPNTNISYTGNFWADKSSTASPAPGTIDVTESGTFVVNPPNDGSGTGQISDKISYSYQERVHKYVDNNGDSRITDEGTYTLFNPAISRSAIGKFVVENTIFKTNPDGSTIVAKSGILSLITFCSPSSITPAETNTTDDSSVCTETPIDPTEIVADGQAFSITKYLVPEADDNGTVINMLKSGDFYLLNPNTGVSWNGRFFVNHAPTSSPTEGETITIEAGTYLVDSSSDGTTTTDPEKKVNYSLDECVIESVDDNGVSSSTDTGTFSLLNPISECFANGSFEVQHTISNTYPNGTTVITKSGILYATKSCTTTQSGCVDKSDTSQTSSTTAQTTTDSQVPASETSTNSTSSGLDEQIYCTTLPAKETLPYDRGYFFFNDHIFATPDANGNKGIGFYSINDPKNNQFTTGTYVLQEAFTITNPDGTEDSRSAGIIFVNSARSSSLTENSDPTLAITNGAKFSFDDHLTYVTDPNGNVHQVGNGILTQTNPVTGLTRFGNYQILDILTINNADGSTDIIESGTFMYTDSSTDGSTTTTTSSSNSSPTTSTGSSQSGTTSAGSSQSGKTSTGSSNSKPTTSTSSTQSGKRWIGLSNSRPTTLTGSSQSGKRWTGSSNSRPTTSTGSSNSSPTTSTGSSQSSTTSAGSSQSTTTSTGSSQSSTTSTGSSQSSTTSTGSSQSSTTSTGSSQSSTTSTGSSQSTTTSTGSSQSGTTSAGSSQSGKTSTGSSNSKPTTSTSSTQSGKRWIGLSNSRPTTLTGSSQSGKRWTGSSNSRPTTSTGSSNSSPTTSTGSSQSSTTSAGSSQSSTTSTGSSQSTTTSTGSSQSSTTSTGSSQSNTTSTTSSNTSPAITNLADLTALLETLTATLNALKAQEEQASSGTVASSTSGSNSGTASAATTDITIPVADVVAAADGQSLSSGDLVIVAANNGDALVGTFQQSVDTVTFRVINSADLAEQILGCTGFVTLPENNFAEQYRIQFDALLNAVHPPCNS